MNTLNELKGYILGDLSVAYYLAAFFFSGLAILISLWMHSRTRDKESERTPKEFSWAFLIWDNGQRVLVGLAVLFLLFRFSVEWFGKGMSMWLAVLIGGFVSFGLDKAIEFMQERYNWFKSSAKPKPESHE